jgi:hypothetical protein
MLRSQLNQHIEENFVTHLLNMKKFHKLEEISLKKENKQLLERIEVLEKEAAVKKPERKNGTCPIFCYLKLLRIPS